jgi:alkylation response protein AidB-like acyl-CoA dehydrogenase
MVPNSSSSLSVRDSDSTKLGEDLLARAQAIASVVEGEAEEAEAKRTLQPKTVGAFRDAELLRGFLPVELGGYECDLSTLIAVVAELSRQDGAAGWCFGMNGFITSVCAANLPDEGIDEIYQSGERDPSQVLMAGGFPPMGRAVREGEGWRVSGDFRFGSGILHADYVVCTALEIEDDAPVMDGAIPLMRTFVVPREQVRIEDNWRVAGLEGTGSCDYHLDDHWSPESLSFVANHSDPIRGRSLYSLPLLTVANAPHCGFALGVGRRALEEIRDIATSRYRLGSSAPLAERPAFQQSFGRASTRFEAAEVLVTTRAAALQVAHRAGVLTIQHRAGLTAATTNAYESALEAAQVAFRAAGGAALYRSVRLQRCWRDIQAGCQHIVPSEESWERVAQVGLGLPDPGML